MKKPDCEEEASSRRAGRENEQPDEAHPLPHWGAGDEDRNHGRNRPGKKQL